MIYAVIDTNVFVAALLTKHRDAATAKVGCNKHYTSPALFYDLQTIV